ncbi:MAG: hypothetical protein AAB133_04470, partial [Pseudomonadota bacterium]
SEALSDYIRASGLNPKSQIEIFLKNRSTIERLTRTKYLSHPIEEPGTVLIKTEDMPMKETSSPQNS